MRGWTFAIKLALAAGLFLLETAGASARSLQSVTAGGAITLCAHPNALPSLGPGARAERFMRRMGWDARARPL